MKKLRGLTLLMTTLLLWSLATPVDAVRPDTDPIIASVAHSVPMSDKSDDADHPGEVCGELCFDPGHLRAYGPFNGKRVGSINLCVEQTSGVDSSGLPVRLAAERWDYSGMFIRHEDHFDLDACHEYNSGQTLDVQMTDVVDGRCYHFYQVVGSNGVRIRTIGYLNRHYPDCWSTPIRREHYTGAMVGDWLGMARHTGYIYTVMNKNRYNYERGPTLHHDIASVDYYYNR